MRLTPTWFLRHAKVFSTCVHKKILDGVERATRVLERPDIGARRGRSLSKLDERQARGLASTRVEERVCIKNSSARLRQGLESDDCNTDFYIEAVGDTVASAHSAMVEACGGQQILTDEIDLQ